MQNRALFALVDALEERGERARGEPSLTLGAPSLYAARRYQARRRAATSAEVSAAVAVVDQEESEARAREFAASYVPPPRPVSPYRQAVEEIGGCGEIG